MCVDCGGGRVCVCVEWGGGGSRTRVPVPAHSPTLSPRQKPISAWQDVIVTIGTGVGRAMEPSCVWWLSTLDLWSRIKKNDGINKEFIPWAPSYGDLSNVPDDMCSNISRRLLTMVYDGSFSPLQPCKSSKPKQVLLLY